MSKTAEWFNLTFATWRGFWCSTPPWRRKPHGAPPDNVIITSSATIFLPFLSFFPPFLAYLLFFFFLLFIYFLNFIRGPLSVLAPWSLPHGALMCSLPATPSGCWAEVRLQGRYSHLNTHANAHTLLFTHPHRDRANLHREANGEREGQRIMMGGGVCVCLLWRMPSPKEWWECSVQHLSCHSGLCHRVVDSPPKNRTALPLLFCLLIGSAS